MGVGQGDGVLVLFNSATKQAIYLIAGGAGQWIYTSWLAIDRMAPMRQEHYLAEILKEYSDVRTIPNQMRSAKIIGWDGSVPTGQ